MSSLGSRLWTLLSVCLAAPILFPFILANKIATSTAFSRKTVAETVSDRSEDLPRIEYLYFLGGILAQQGLLVTAPRELMGGGISGESDPLSMSISVLILFGTARYCWIRRAEIARGLSRNILILAFPLLNLLSTGWSMDPAVTFKRSIFTIGATLFWLYMAIRLSLPQALALLSRAVFICAWGSLLFTLAFPNLGREIGEGMQGEWRGITAQKNSLGHLMAMGVFVLVFRMLLLRKVNFWGGATVCLCMILIKLSQSSTSLTASLFVFLGCATYLLLHRGADGRLLVGSLGLISFVVAVIAMMFDPTAPLALLGKDTTLTGRTELWSYVIELIHERPLFGWGYKAMWSPDATQTSYIWNQIRWDAPEAHNGYLEIGLSLGLMGWLTLSLTFYAWARRIVLCLSKGDTFLAAALCVIVIQQLFINFTESMFNDTAQAGWALTMYLAFYAGYITLQSQPKCPNIGQVAQEEGSSSPITPRRRFRPTPRMPASSQSDNKSG